MRIAFRVKLTPWGIEGHPMRYYVNGVRTPERTAEENYLALYRQLDPELINPSEKWKTPKLYIEDGKLIGDHRSDLYPSAVRHLHKLYRTEIERQEQTARHLRHIAGVLNLPHADLLTADELLETARNVYRSLSPEYTHFPDRALNRIIKKEHPLPEASPKPIDGTAGDEPQS